MYPYITIISPTTGSNFSINSTNNNANLSNPIKMLDGSYSTNKCFQLSSANEVVSSLNGSCTFFEENGYPGYLGSSIYTGVSTTLAILNLTYHGETIEAFDITFDVPSNEYAIDFSVQNVTKGTSVNVIDNEQLNVKVNLNIEDGNVIQISVTKWSKLNATVKISSISFIGDGKVYVFYSLMNFRCSQNMMDGDLLPNPGICEQYADINLYDVNNILHYRALNGEITNEETIYVQLIDDFQESQDLGTYQVYEWAIDSNTSDVQINCRDLSFRFDKINVSRAQLATRTIDDLLQLLFTEGSELPWGYLDNETAIRCTSILIPNNWWLETNLKTVLEKICSLGMLRIYWYFDQFYVGRCI